MMKNNKSNNQRCKKHAKSFYAKIIITFQYTKHINQYMININPSSTANHEQDNDRDNKD